jgi:hypothetical protein
LIAADLDDKRHELGATLLQGQTAKASQMVMKYHFSVGSLPTGYPQ